MKGNSNSLGKLIVVNQIGLRTTLPGAHRGLLCYYCKVAPQRMCEMSERVTMSLLTAIHTPATHTHPQTYKVSPL
jgi:hypothetical protein